MLLYLELRSIYDMQNGLKVRGFYIGWTLKFRFANKIGLNRFAHVDRNLGRLIADRHKSTRGPIIFKISFILR